MSGGSNAGEWLNFFINAGIKEGAETYAVTFANNHMKLDMLSELKKEYLVEMGITRIGHIIDILRHAKTVHEASVTRTTLAKKVETLVEQSQEIDSVQDEEPKIVMKSMDNRTPATRILTHYIPKNGVTEGKKEMTGAKTVEAPLKMPRKISTTPSPSLGSKEENVEEKKKKIGRIDAQQNHGVSSTLAPFKQQTTSSVNPKIPPRPSQSPPKVVSSTSVFSRLGLKEGVAEVQKTLPHRSPPTVEPSVKMIKRPVMAPPSFPSTQPSPGILKNARKRLGPQLLVPISNNKTMRADEPEVPVHARTKFQTFTVGNTVDRKGSIKERLGETESVNGNTKSSTSSVNMVTKNMYCRRTI